MATVQERIIIDTNNLNRQLLTLSRISGRTEYYRIIQKSIKKLEDRLAEAGDIMNISLCLSSFNPNSPRYFNLFSASLLYIILSGSDMMYNNTIYFNNYSHKNSYK